VELPGANVIHNWDFSDWTSGKPDQWFVNPRITVTQEAPGIRLVGHGTLDYINQNCLQANRVYVIEIMISEVVGEVRVGASPSPFVTFTTPGLHTFEYSVTGTGIKPIAIFFEDGHAGEALVDYITAKLKP
jgi:hypothetical protein